MTEGVRLLSNNIPTREELRKQRDANRIAFAAAYKEKIKNKRAKEEELSDPEKYAIDLCAELHGLPISKMMDVQPEQLQMFLAFHCFDVGLAISSAEDYYVEQLFGEPDREQDGDRYHLRVLTRKILGKIREELKKEKDEELSIVEIAISLFELNLGLWESTEMVDRYSIKRHVVGRKESRELEEKVRNIEI